MLFTTLTICLSFVSLNTAAVIVEKTSKGIFEEIEPTPNEELLKEDKDFWYNMGNEQLSKILKFENEPKKHVAKNVVVLVGDGMGIPTITAARIYAGQRYYGTSGEDYQLVYDNFPNVALVKTYNVDMQVPDSAGTATAIFSGVKTRSGAIGVDVTVNKTDPDKDVYEAHKLDSIMDWAQNANKDTGIITTTRITHATPACTYARIHHRDWECDSRVPNEFKPFVKDIARQLIEDAPGKNFKVILGGGYQQLGHVAEDVSGACVRQDNLNLTKTWLDNHKDLKAAFVVNNEQLANVGDVDYLMGLFHPNHIPYNLMRNQEGEGTPSLYDMTKKALEILKKNPNGYVLMIEGGRIDHGHHDNCPRLALEESSEFEKTVKLVVDEGGPDTLILVTADHSHSMTVNGYPQRGNDILGFGDESEGNPGLTVSYANGPGFNYHYSPEAHSILGPWINSQEDPNRLNDPQYRHIATFHLSSETHGGDDVGLFATGPGSYLVKGVLEQSYIAHLISYAACIGPRSGMNPYCNNTYNAGSNSVILNNFLFMLVLITILIQVLR